MLQQMTVPLTPHVPHSMGCGWPSRRLVNLVDAPDWDEVASKGVVADAMLQLALIAQRQRASVREPVAALCDLLTAAVQRYAACVADLGFGTFS